MFLPPFYCHWSGAGAGRAAVCAVLRPAAVCGRQQAADPQRQVRHAAHTQQGSTGEARSSRQAAQQRQLTVVSGLLPARHMHTGICGPSHSRACTWTPWLPALRAHPSALMLLASWLHVADSVVHACCCLLLRGVCCSCARSSGPCSRWTQRSAPTYARCCSSWTRRHWPSQASPCLHHQQQQQHLCHQGSQPSALQRQHHSRLLLSRRSSKQ